MATPVYINYDLLKQWVLDKHIQTQLDTHNEDGTQKEEETDDNQE